MNIKNDIIEQDNKIIDEKVYELLKKHDYAVTVHKSNKGITLKTPLSFFGTYLPLAVKYLVDYEGERAIITVDVTNDERNLRDTMVHKCPAYAARLWVFCDVCNNCQYLRYDTTYLGMLNDNMERVDELESHDLIFYLPQPTTPEDEEKEGLLAVAFIDARRDGFDARHDKIMLDLGVLEGYDFVKNLFEETD